MTGIGKDLSMYVTAPIIGVGVAVSKMGMDFEAQMSRVKAISQATGDEFTKLNDLALKLGADTTFSSKQAAEGMENLASAGFKTTEIMSAMPGMLDLAASGGLDIATSADIAASSLRGFGLNAGQAGHVADVLAKAAADTNADVTGMGMAMKYAAPPAKALGMSIEETATAIGIMSDAGIKGEMAGTTLRGSLINLASPSKEAAGLMKDLGFSAFDSHGKMLPFADVIGKLQKATKRLSDEKKADALATIFGKEALSGMMVLMDAGPGKIDKLTKSFEQSDGAAKAMAATMLDNTKGSIEQMTGSLETAGITLSTVLAPIIIQIADKITELANKFSGLSDETKKTILVIAGIVAAIGPAVYVIGSLITAVGWVTGVVGAASTAVAAAGGVIAVITGPIGIAVVAIAALVAGGILLYKNWDTIKVKAGELWIGLKNTFAGIKKSVLAIVTEAKDWGMNIVKGIGNGISDMANWIKTQVTNFCNHIGNTVKNFFGIQSPSKLMTEYGQYISQGLADGMKNNQQYVEKQGDALAAVIQSKTEKAKEAAIERATQMAGKVKQQMDIMTEAISDAVSKLNEKVSLTVDIAQAEFEKLKAEMGGTTDKAKLHEAQLVSLNTQMTAHNEKISVLKKAYEDMIKTKKGASEESQKLYLELLQEQTASANLAKQIAETNRVQQQRALTTKDIDWTNPSDVIGKYTQIALQNAFASGQTVGSTGNLFTVGGANIGTIPKFDVGTNFVPADMLAFVHKGEEITPAKYNPANGGSSSRIITIINKGTIVGRNGMEEFAKIIGQKLGGNYALSLGGDF